MLDANVATECFLPLYIIMYELTHIYIALIHGVFQPSSIVLQSNGPYYL